MTIEKLMELRNSNNAPFDHQEYTMWLHNEIINDIRYELESLRDKEPSRFKSVYACCNNVMSLPSLQTIK